MSRKNSNYQLLISKLDQFIRKYYFNKLIKGFLYSIGVVLIAFLAISLLEYYFYFSTTVRKTLFYGFLGLVSIIGLISIIIPVLHIFKLGRVISHEQAATIIGSHFTNVKDKLLNILQLKEQSSTLEDASLIEASITQKIDNIKLVPFTAAVDLSKNKKYVKYAIIPTLLFLAILFGAPNLITDSTNRLINNDQTFEPEAPFRFIVTTENLEVIQYENLLVEVKIDGVVLPNEAAIHINNFPYKLKKLSPTSYTYQFNKLQKDTKFFLEANGFRSKDYEITVIPKPTMLNFDAVLNYPAYTGKTNETLRNSGDMVIPMGTKVTWNFKAQHTDNVQMSFGQKGKLKNVKTTDKETFTYQRRFVKDNNYTVFLSSKKIKHADSISYGISVIPDNYPTITAEEKRDSLDEKYLYFLGDVSDDYGIKNLYFKYQIAPKEKEDKTTVATGTYQKIPIAITNPKASSFTHMWDLNRMNLKAGDQITYFFEVWDNDAVNGSKSAKSQIMSYELPTIEELDEEVSANSEQLKDDLGEVMNEAKELSEKVKDIKDKLTQKKEMTWEDKAQIEDLLKRHKNMENKLENMKENFQENLEKQEEYKEFSEEMKEKQEKLEKLFEELMTDEMKEMMEKLEKLMEDMKKDDAIEDLENSEELDQQLEKELDRLAELLKQMEFEQKMEETIDKLDKLAEEQEKLGEETEKDKDGNLEEEKKEQEKLNEKFDKLKEDMEELDKMSEELKNSQKAGEKTEEQQQSISQDQQQSMQQMEQKENQKAGKKQKDAAEKMKDMADAMRMMQMEMEMNQTELDMQAIRQLLENLITLSKDQESLISEIMEVNTDAPKYVELVQEQYKLKDDAKLVEDSLIALSKRVFQLESFITKEIAEVNRNLKDAIEQLEDRKVARSSTHQQYVMTGVNNLALMLSEVMEQMQQQMAQKMQGSQMCQKPGQKPGGKGNKMSKLQKQLNQQLKEMEGMMKQGKKPGKGQMSKEVAKMAAKQAAIRQALEQLNQQQNKDGKKGLGDLEELSRQMEQTEADLVNKKITAELIQRQREILSRLLKAENAQQEREWDDKREAKTAQQKTRQVPPEIEEYLKKKQSEVELYKTVPPALKPYYKSMVEKYFKAISF